MKKWIYWLAAIFALLGAAFWWLLIDARAPATADDVYDLAVYRVMVSADGDTLPTEIRIETVGTDIAPGFAAVLTLPVAGVIVAPGFAAVLTLPEAGVIVAPGFAAVPRARRPSSFRRR